jgi:hypothetical protein
VYLLSFLEARLSLEPVRRKCRVAGIRWAIPPVSRELGDQPLITPNGLIRQTFIGDARAVQNFDDLGDVLVPPRLNTWIRIESKTISFT